MTGSTAADAFDEDGVVIEGAAIPKGTVLEIQVGNEPGSASRYGSFELARDLPIQALREVGTRRDGLVRVWDLVTALQDGGYVVGKARDVVRVDVMDRAKAGKPPLGIRYEG